jgi:ABC-type transport system involved in cytochrome c biogenesis permease subunit
MMRPETVWLMVALSLYGMATVTAVLIAALKRASYRGVLAMIALALVFHGTAIILRWQRLDHGPYVNLFEILSSNVWSLHLAIFAGCAYFREIRPSTAVVLPVLQVLVFWLLAVAPVDAPAPVTYDTAWLAVHVWLGKVFLGCIVVAVGISLVVLARRSGFRRAFEMMPDDAALDVLIYRIVLVAFIFESLMLVAGAIWAQDAWGRYWAWDPLETWAFITWLSVVGFLHLRATRQPTPATSAVIVVAVFVIAFSTFFGTPFVSTAPHKGAI